jgi:putative oxidoreductase
MFNSFFKRHADSFYAVARILLGLLFIQHGLQKLFGMFSGNAASLFSLMGLAGVVEFFGGLLIVLGLFTRIAALVSAVQMLVAYFMAHASNGLFPIVNKGELALVYFAGFLIITAFGARKWGLDNKFGWT